MSNKATRWIIEDHPTESAKIRDAETGQDIGTVFCTDLPCGAANARLLVSAPALLEALESVLKGYDVDETDPVVIAARTAIAQATGGQ